MNVRATTVALAACLSACAGPALTPSVAPSAPKRDALLVLPGFGYGRDDEEAFRAVARTSSAAGMDVYVASYLTRSGLGTSRDRLARFARDHRLDRYERLHVFAFIAGGWTVNPLAESGGLPNLASITYDRSPYQERAPRIAADSMPLLAWLRYGSTVFDVARTPYTPLRAEHVRVALMVESMPTAFIKQHEAAARKDGPFDFDCDSFVQRYDDCLYLAMDHDDVYARFADIWPELIAFIQTGRFSDTANRTPPTGDPLTRRAAK